MAIVAIFQSAPGVRPGLIDFADELRTVGREMHVVDQYDERVFDDYEEAAAYGDEVGFPNLMAEAIRGVADLPNGFATIGFSNGAGMAEFVAANRRVSGAMGSGALPLETIGITWPQGVPAQIHSTVGDPRDQHAIRSVRESVEEAGGAVEVFEDPGSGHLREEE